MFAPAQDARFTIKGPWQGEPNGELGQSVVVECAGVLLLRCADPTAIFELLWAPPGVDREVAVVPFSAGCAKLWIAHDMGGSYRIRCTVNPYTLLAQHHIQMVQYRQPTWGIRPEVLAVAGRGYLGVRLVR